MKTIQNMVLNLNNKACSKFFGRILSNESQNTSFNFITIYYEIEVMSLGLFHTGANQDKPLKL
jgi:hypothetical protein